MKPKKNAKADLRKKSNLFLSFGLILALLASLLLIEWKTYDKEEFTKEQVYLDELEEEVIPITELANTPPPKPPVIPDEIEVIKDDPEAKEDEIESTETNLDDIVEPEEIIEHEPDEEIETVPFTLIEDVPIFPGCEALEDNSARKSCMSEKITAYVNKNFNKDLGSELGLSGVNRINILFQINTEGEIVNIQARAPHPELEKEAENIIKSLPKMQPGKQRGKPVNVNYALPIIFQVQE
ncbi:energy transducer TonB [Salegentibacter salinarum]|uniref:Energy transducer TonB n=1 Tax=Salegentibacter salinarum TaxID=447422 RepID=A0A2N0U351_9FLAO|nr:energy transducer TonB [Salegentibacter salinarum]PKD21433.1 energy transducer TonB [Salegentibacter salinarum]SKB38782.1 protein TonB [Salegentibacter salinarum]